MTIVGNIVLDDKDYLEKLNNLISKYDLIEPDVPFDELVQKSSIFTLPQSNLL
jgi:hypothetical protein